MFSRDNVLQKLFTTVIPEKFWQCDLLVSEGGAVIRNKCEKSPERRKNQQPGRGESTAVQMRVTGLRVAKPKSETRF